MNDKTFQRAKLAISKAWSEVKDVEETGLAFGKLCMEWEPKLGSLYPLFKEIGITPTVAYWWRDQYARSIGTVGLHKEKRPNRGTPKFEDVQKLALRIVLAGYKTLHEANPEDRRVLQAAKDWAQARLSRTDL